MAEQKISFYIENKSIEKLYSWVCSEDVEICGRLMFDSHKNVYKIDESELGRSFNETYLDENKKEHKRKACDYPHPRGYMFFHTHPISSKSYPSDEDIMSIAKLSYDKLSKPLSIIGTKWGIWYIRKRNRHIPLSKLSDDGIKFYDGYKNQSKILYRLKLYDIDDNKENILLESINVFSKNMNILLKDYCQIAFVRWSEMNIKNGQYIGFSLLPKKKSTRKSTRKSIRKSTRKSIRNTRKSTRNTKKSIRKSIRNTRKSIRNTRNMM